MENHYHLLIRTRQGNLSRAIQRLVVNYTGWFNCRHKRSGHLFQGCVNNKQRNKQYVSIQDGSSSTKYWGSSPTTPRKRGCGLSRGSCKFSRPRRLEFYRVDAIWVNVNPGCVAGCSDKRLCLARITLLRSGRRRGNDPSDHSAHSPLSETGACKRP
jgi:hypothetical protein